MKLFIISVFQIIFLCAIIGTTVAHDLRQMVKIPPGTFEMGRYKGEYSSQKRKVHLNAFLMDKYEVTQGDYVKLMRENPSDQFNHSPFKWIGDNYPVTNVTWYDAARYCNARSRAEGFEPCYDDETLECDFSKNGYRLPTEAEWEYVCRAGTDTKYFFGDDENKLIEYANYWPERKKWYHAMYTDGLRNENTKWEGTIAKLMPVGQKKPNPWGLYDILGNTWEWCNDWYDEDYYEKSAKVNQRGPNTGKFKILRGGAYNSGDLGCASSRSYKEPEKTDRITGFRCVRNAPKEENTEEKPVEPKRDDKEEKKE